MAAASETLVAYVASMVSKAYVAYAVSAAYKAFVVNVTSVAYAPSSASVVSVAASVVCVAWKVVAPSMVCAAWKVDVASVVCAAWKVAATSVVYAAWKAVAALMASDASNVVAASTILNLQNQNLEHKNRNFSRKEEFGVSSKKVMSIVSWNVRGLNGDIALRQTKLLLKYHKAFVIFFMETKLAEGKLDYMKKCLGFEEGYEVPRNDHRALIVNMQERTDNSLKIMRKRPRFRFENMWAKESECQSIIKDSWSSSSTSSINAITRMVLNKEEDEYYNIINTPDSQLILSIPITLYEHDDDWLWHFTSHGHYSVKSGYNLAIGGENLQPSSSNEVMAAWWSAYWAIKIPKKILHFGWKGFHEILPSFSGLFRRQSSSHSNCPICGFGNDTNAHAIFWCSFSQVIWKEMSFPFLASPKEDLTFKGVLLYASEILEKEDFEKVLISAWTIWFERNKKSHGRTIRTPHQIKIWISSYYNEICRERNKTKKGVSTGCTSEQSNTETEVNSYKLFVDAAISTPQNVIGFGAVIFSSDKQMKAALSKPLQGIKR
ncbi:hypothetical protein G4B88_001940 [Cannabis sativa]|uniref:Reverse transcriptase zinc-binding domain-containing protein n=1 Tax=Cannabis sativa TaxID=3483 RepID=A0A7J6HCY8_CANSA|nr:hypothetical protein G4B88_001940 [Cannabis sativa]